MAINTRPDRNKPVQINHHDPSRSLGFAVRMYQNQTPAQTSMSAPTVM
jgi:hypothetical protein